MAAEMDPTEAATSNEPPLAQVIIGGGVAVMLGSFMPWVSVGFVSASGVEGGDGWLTLVGGAVLAWLGYRMLRSRSMAPAAAGTAMAVAALVVYEFINISQEHTVGDGDFSFEISASPAAGLYLCAAGTVAALVSSLMAWKRARTI